MKKILLKMIVSLAVALTLMVTLNTSHMTATEPKDTWISNEYLPYINRISYQYHKRTMELERLHEEKEKESSKPTKAE